MRKLFIIFCLPLIFWPLIGQTENLVPLPSIASSPIADEAGLLAPQEEELLKRDIFALKEQKNIMLAVVTIPTLAQESIEQFSIRLAENSKLGGNRIDNGLILVIAVQERQVRLEVGQGLEGEITDYLSHQIIKNLILPQLKQGKTFEAVRSLLGALGLQGVSTENGNWDRQSGLTRRQLALPHIGPGFLFGLAFITFAIIPLAGLILKNSLVRGVLGGALFMGMGFVGFGAVSIALLIGLALVGLIIGMLGPMQLLYLLAQVSGRGGGFGGGGGGGSWGGDGGRFGGGGASGSW